MRESRERAPAFVAMVTARGALQVNTTNTQSVGREMEVLLLLLLDQRRSNGL